MGTLHNIQKYCDIRNGKLVKYINLLTQDGETRVCVNYESQIMVR
jgi:hypothetical protein